VSMVSRDLWPPHDHDADRSRHDPCLEYLVLIRPRNVGKHAHVQQNASASELSEQWRDEKRRDYVQRLIDLDTTPRLTGRAR
jgi:hypothetical protein